MKLRPFERADLEEYRSWFEDPELNRRLGPLDAGWEDATFAEQRSHHETWAVVRGGELVAVVETAFDPDGQQPPAIIGLATRPELRGQGIGTDALRLVLQRHAEQGLAVHIALVEPDNVPAQRAIEKLGFHRTTEPHQHGFIWFRREG